MTLKAITGGAAFSAAVALGLGLSALPAHASYVVTLTQKGGEVVASGSGTIDTDDFTFGTSGPGATHIHPEIGQITTGELLAQIDVYAAPLEGPTSFGSGGQTHPTTGAGDLVGIRTGGAGPFVFVPQGYVSDAPLSDTATYAGQTLSSLGVTPGKYVWTWGDGADAGSFTLVASVVPETSTWVMMLAGFAGLGYAGYRTSRQRALGA
jgi:hypothetical protein